MEEHILLAVPSTHPLCHHKWLHIADLEKKFLTLSKNWALGIKMSFEVSTARLEVKMQSPQILPKYRAP